MPQLTYSKFFGLTVTMLVVFYGMFAFFTRSSLLAAADHLKVLLFAGIVSSWIWLWVVLGIRLEKKRFGLRVALVLAVSLLIGLVSGLLQSAFRHDPVWMQLWDTSHPVFIGPAALLTLASRPPKQEATDAPSPSS